MTAITKIKTGSTFEEKESYSRAVVVDNWIFVSNTAGRNYATREMASNAVGQIHQAFANARAALQSVDATLEDVVRSRVFIPYIEDVPEVMAVVGEYFRGIDPASTVTCSPLGGPDYRAEIELTAYRGAGQLPQERRTITI